jgi:hypothetical protein
MRFLLLLLATLFISTLSFAKQMEGGEGGMGRMSLAGYYGYTSVVAGDVNNLINGVSGISPKLNNLTSGWFYGGEFGYMINPRWQVIVDYQQEWARNPVNTNVGNNSGVELLLNSAWGGLNYWFHDRGPIRLAIGAEAGYPTYAHASVITNTRSEYDASFNPMFQGLATGEFRIVKHFAFVIKGGYQYALLGPLTQGSTAQNLHQANGSNVNLDMSGWRGQAGIVIDF